GNTIWDIPYGLPGVETLFPIMFTYGPGNGIEYPKVSKLLSLNPAIIFGLYPKKGALYPGFDADIIVIDPIKRKEIKPSNLHMSSDYSPYEGFILSGFPDMVFSRGKLILKDEKFLGEKGRGKYIKRRVIR
ncbi:MAG TPA: dihydropyrimidinase, partial [Candidatus Atribacteria bacterium]|nr:dihydropyrimidinase [Candidatus Atribacteria bacterium]